MTEQEKARTIIKRHGYEAKFSSFGGIHFYTSAPWQPEIYTEVANDRPAAFQIQTSSYGALGLQEVHCMINGLEEAMAMVTELNEVYGISG